MDYFRKTKSLYSSTTNSFSTGEAETITPNSVVGLPTDTEIVLTFDRTVAGKLERIRGTISGGNFVVASGGRGEDGTTEQAHTSPTVEYIPNAADINDMVDGLLIAHDQTGIHKTGTVLTSPKVITSINDTNNNELFKVTATGSAVNEFTVANAASGSDPVLSATGSGTDIGIKLTPKGAGEVQVTANDLNLTAATANIQVNNADPKRGIYVPASGMYGATTNGAATGQIETTTNKVNIKVLDFDASTDEYACFNIPAPDYWDLGTITAQFHWTAASGATSNTVVYGLQGLARSNDDALDTAYGTAVNAAADNFIAANDEHITAATTAITIGGTPAKGDMIYFRVLRDVSEDNLGVDARLLGVRIKFGISQYDDQ